MLRFEAMKESKNESQSEICNFQGSNLSAQTQKNQKASSRAPRSGMFTSYAVLER